MAAEVAPVRWLARLTAGIVAPRHPVGAVGVIFNEDGKVRLFERAFRTDYPWDLPGGWVERGEHPRDTTARGLREELGLEVEVGARSAVFAGMRLRRPSRHVTAFERHDELDRANGRA